MIIFDTETTGFVGPSVLPTEQQPHIIEFAGIKVDDITLEEISRLNFLVNPGVPLSKEAIKVTGLTDDDLKDKPKFAHYYSPLIGFFFGERYLVAHNASFDVSVLALELQRIEKAYKFPWPIMHICTIENTLDMLGYRLSLKNLYDHLFGIVSLNPEKLHRAGYDVEVLYRCVKALRELGRI